MGLMGYIVYFVHTVGVVSVCVCVCGGGGGGGGGYTYKTDSRPELLILWATLHLNSNLHTRGSLEIRKAVVK